LLKNDLIPKYIQVSQYVKELLYMLEAKVEFCYQQFKYTTAFFSANVKKHIAKITDINKIKNCSGKEVLISRRPYKYTTAFFSSNVKLKKLAFLILRNLANLARVGR
jgi:hypothetical protein